MPLYEYRCNVCGHRFEKIQTYSAPDQKECPVCKGEVERLISAPSIQFKGSGFYSTDYPSRASKSAATEGKSESKSGDSGSGSSEGSSGEKSVSSEKGPSDKNTSSSDKSTSVPASSASTSSPTSSSKD